MRFKARHRGLLDFAAPVGLRLEPFQRKIARAADDVRELLVLLPRGNGKSRLIGTMAVYHLLTTEKPAVYLAAASRDQARVVFEYARGAVAELRGGDGRPTTPRGGSGPRRSATRRRRKVAPRGYAPAGAARSPAQREGEGGSSSGRAGRRQPRFPSPRRRRERAPRAPRASY